MTNTDRLREQALRELQQSDVLMLDGHFDYGNGYHGRVYLNPHALFRHPSTIWRVCQDLLDVLPFDLLEQIDVVAGPATGGALLAHTLAGLLDGRRSLTRPPCCFAPFNYDHQEGFALRRYYASRMAGQRVLVADDVRNTGKTFERCVSLVREAGGIVIATAEIYDRQGPLVDPGVPNFALVEYRAAENFPAGQCPMCREGRPVTAF
jgi:orotate phosphoribosyltransferase